MQLIYMILRNFKNNLDATIINIGIKGDHINSGCVYSNIDNRMKNLAPRFLSAIDNIPT